MIDRGEGDNGDISTEDSQINLSLERFRTGTSQLNSLLQRRVGLVREVQETGAVVVPTSDACGSWESIVNWGRLAGLDAEQQVAFEILEATYVLTFYEEANNNFVDGSQAGLKENERRLKQLARRRPETEVPLRMFVTGPAGAGKCKEQTFV